MAKPPPITAIEAPSPLWRRLAWFAGLWLASLGAVATVAYGLRALLFG